MTLSPASDTANKSSEPSGGASYGSGFGSGTGTGSGSGSGGNPTLSLTSIPLAETSDGTGGRHYKVDNDLDHDAPQDEKVPVGKIVNVTAFPPMNKMFQTIAWAGGTDYKDYYQGAAKTEAPTHQQVTTGVETDEAKYAFIVDPDPRAYSITVTVTYVGGGGGSADFAYTSVRPDVSFDINQGTPKLLTSPNGVQIRLDNNNNVSPPAVESAGMRITATTTTSEEFGGRFMFMQLISPVRVTRQLDNDTFRQWLPEGSWAIDNGFNDFRGANYGGGVGYPITDNDNKQGNFYYWESNPDESESHKMGDNPVTPLADLDNKTLQVGDMNAGRPEKFDTYVMYKPTPDDTAVWVNLGKVHWEWGSLAGNNPDNQGNFLGGLPAHWALLPFPDLPQAKSTVPVGATEYFPKWTDRAMDILDRDWQKFQ